MGKQLPAIAKGVKPFYCFFLIDGFKEKTIRLYEKEIEWQKINWLKFAETF